MKYFLLYLCLMLLTSCSLVSSLVEEEVIEAPIISDLQVNPTDGPAPLLSSVNWEITSPSGEPVTCTLDFGTGAIQTLENCSQLSSIFYTYERKGGYILVLTASVGDQETVRSIPVTVQAPTIPVEGGATITELLITPNNAAAPMLTSVKWQLSGLNDYGDGTIETIDNCSQVNDAFHEYLEPGGYILVLSADDGEAQISKSISVIVTSPETSDTNP
jgi:hypothetical protein